MKNIVVIMAIIIMGSSVCAYGDNLAQIFKDNTIVPIEKMNTPIFSVFISTFFLLDADIRVTRKGITKPYLFGEGNPVSKAFTDCDNWAGFYAYTYLVNTTVFVGLGIIGDLVYKDSPIAKYMLQSLYVVAFSLAEITALNQWARLGVHVDVTVPLLYITF